MLVDYDTYRLLTGDSTSVPIDVEDQLAVAQGLIEEYLDRPLESKERTERLRLHQNGRVWPTSTPITVAAGYTIEGAGLLGASPVGLSPPFSDPPGTSDLYAEVTYTGGYTAENCPTTLKRAIAKLAFANLHPSSVSLPAGVVSARVGDASVTYSDPADVDPVLGPSLARSVRRYNKAGL